MAEARSGQGKGKCSVFVAAVALAIAATPAFAQRKACEELKAEIEAKIRKNGVEKFTLEIVDMAAQAEGKVVGTCDGQTKKIVYKRG
ncbi:MAG TPA: DUF1161 domain-containing protein [Burkholderiales bacterium]|nr:DUF1161 domain-containing protein [Burkholderiales bacterium]